MSISPTDRSFYPATNACLKETQNQQKDPRDCPNMGKILKEIFTNDTNDEIKNYSYRAATFNAGVTLLHTFSNGSVQPFPIIYKFNDGNVFTELKERQGTLKFQNGPTYLVNCSINPNEMKFTTQDGATINYFNGIQNDPPVPYHTDSDTEDEL